MLTRCQFRLDNNREAHLRAYLLLVFELSFRTLLHVGVMKVRVIHVFFLKWKIIRFQRFRVEVF